MRSYLRMLYALFRQTTAAVAYYSGLNKLYLFLKAKMLLGRPRILCFHDVSDSGPVRSRLSINIRPEYFERFVSFISRNFQIVTINEAVEAMKENIRLKKDILALSFDDCYKGWYDNVLPICTEMGTPFTVFVTTEPLDTGRMLTYDALIYLLENTSQDVADLREYGGGTYSLMDPDQADLFLQTANQLLMEMPITDRAEAMMGLERYFGVSLNDSRARSSILTWDDLIAIDTSGGNIGAHSMHHPDMERMAIEDCAEEARGCKNRLETMLGHQVEHYAYPYGRIGNNKKSVEAAGYRYAFTLKETNHSGFDPFMIPRICVNDGMMLGINRKISPALLAVELSGLGDLLFLRWLRRLFSRNNP